MQISESIINVLNVLCEKFGIAVDWTNQNIIPYLTDLSSRICTYEIATSITWILGIIVLVSGCTVYCKYSWKRTIDWNTYDLSTEQFHAILSAVLLFFVGLGGIIVIGIQLFDIAKAIWLPELIVVDYIQSLT